MPVRRSPREGPLLLRPFLALPRRALDAYVAARGLAWVDDESNATTSARRNLVRHEVAPRLAAAFPGYPATLSRAAAHQAEAALLMDDLAQHDAQRAITDDAVGGPTLDRMALAALAARAPHRARNLLRWFLVATTSRAVGGAAHGHARPARECHVRCAGAWSSGDRDRVSPRHIVVHAPTVAPFAVTWRGEGD